MGDFLKQFFGFLIFSPLTAVVFGFGIWLFPAFFLRNTTIRPRLRFFHFFVSGYVFIALMTLYLLAVGSRSSDGHRHHQAGPFAGMLASLALAWWLNRLLRARFPDRFTGRKQKAGAPAAPPPGYPAPPQPPYGHPGYRPPPGYPAHPGYPPQGYPPPGYPTHPGYPAYEPPPPAAPPQGAPEGTGDQPRTPGVPWVVPPPSDPTPPPTSSVD
jgi:hypothetical protein